MTLAAGHGDWFGMLDASYVRTNIDEFDGELLTEIGSNFDDASLMVMSATYRF